MPGQLCILWESTTKSSSPRHVTHSVCHKMRHLQAYKESEKITSITGRKIILDGLEMRELMNSVHKNLRAWLYVCERALESKDVEESGMQIVAEHGGRHTIFKEETTPNGANWRSWTPENDGCREGTRKDACQKTQRKNTEKHRGPVNSGTTSIYRQAVGSQGERRKQSGEITVKSSPAPNRIHKF